MNQISQSPIQSVSLTSKQNFLWWQQRVFYVSPCKALDAIAPSYGLLVRSGIVL